MIDIIILVLLCYGPFLLNSGCLLFIRCEREEEGVFSRRFRLGQGKESKFLVRRL